MKTEENFGGYCEGYKCQCGWTSGKYLKGYTRIIPPFTSRFVFHNCCPACGATRDQIKLVTGRFLFRRTKRFLWWSEWNAVKFVPKGDEETHQ